MGAPPRSTGPRQDTRLTTPEPPGTGPSRGADGTTADFTVYAVEEYRKDAFPTRRVYGPTGGGAELRLITCGGDFQQTTRSYTSNTVVYAELARRR